MIGKTLAHYEVLEKIGEGGMATVYAARDQKHQRRVALKTIRAEIASEVGTDRFLREIQIAAQLSHPHILPLHDSGESEGTLYYIMPLVEGETLRDRLTHTPSLDAPEAIRLTLQVARALAHAHARGIIHLDIKPENILLVDDDAIVADFGLARAIGVSERERHAATQGLLVGTPAYMSPEQARGLADLDHRSDLYSLGCVLYEMLAGRRPFDAPTRQALLVMRLEEDLPPLPESLGAWAQKLDPLLAKVTARRVSERVASADMLVGLLQVALSEPGLPAPAEKSLLVLPFHNTSPDPENEYFSDGLTEELISDLSRIGNLRVISRTSSMQLKNTSLTVQAMGRELNVGHVLEGSVRKADRNLRITCQLIEIATDRLVWSEKYDGTIDDVFSMQALVSRSIAEALRLKLVPGEPSSVRRPAISNLAAYDYYLKARSDIFSYSPSALDRAIENLLRALEIVGENVILYRGLGMAFWQYCNAGIAPDESFLDQVDVYAAAIESMDPRNPSAATLRGLAHVQRGNLNESIRHLARAYEAEPYDPDVMLWLGAGFCLAGRTGLARPIIDKLMSIDPLTPINHWIHAFVEFVDGNFEEAIPRIRKGVSLVPDRLGMAWEYARFVAASGQRAEALAIIDEAFARSPDDESVFFHMLQMLKAAFTGDREGVHRACNDELRRMVSTDMEYPQSIADCFALVEEIDEAFTWLRLAVNRGFINRRFLVEIDPFLEPLRADPRFAEVMMDVDARNESFALTLEHVSSGEFLDDR